MFLYNKHDFKERLWGVSEEILTSDDDRTKLAQFTIFPYQGVVKEKDVVYSLYSNQDSKRIFNKIFLAAEIKKKNNECVKLEALRETLFRIVKKCIFYRKTLSNNFLTSTEIKNQPCAWKVQKFQLLIRN